ncbi:MAG: DUF4252 domain-containing protein [Flavobacteriaceae bacterium]|jgi:archaellum biogenesis protein FlaJ (TadC family)|nr:DUF4252 domain-containing protein [Flavobacteriaceae bacterium]
MKKFFVTLFLMLAPLSLLAQPIFEKYQNNKEVSAITITPKMFQLLGSMSLSTGDPESDALMEMISGITLFKALITGSESISDEIDQWVKNEADAKGLDSMVSLKESDAELILYIKENDQKQEIDRLLMFSKGIADKVPEAQLEGKNIEAILLLIEGEIEMDKIAKLITKMNLPGGDQLIKAGI